MERAVAERGSQRRYARGREESVVRDEEQESQQSSQ